MAGDRRSVTLAVVVVSYNVRDLLRVCLAGTYASLDRSPELDATVWVVDNASADGSAGMVAADFPQARLIPSSENLGFPGGNNLVLRRLGFGSADVPPEIILLLNPDAEPLDDAIGQMAGFLREHPGVGAVGAQLSYPDGSFQHGAFRFPGLWQLWFDLFPPHPRRLLDSRLNGRYPRAVYETGRPFAVDFALGAALMVRAEAIRAAGLLDEGYFMYAEEVDWCWRMQRAGWPLYCVPTARVVHYSGASTRQFRSQSFVNLWRSRRRLYQRFYGPLRFWAASRIVQLGMGAEMRRARALAARGEISAADLSTRVEAARQVRELFGEKREAQVAVQTRPRGDADEKGETLR
jgi:N-acetylglucosaminyl-diphospho-decaprenol L-rhamnosyltransferase